MRCMPLNGCKPHWTETSGCLWPEIWDCTRLQLLAGAKKIECRLERSNLRSLATKPHCNGPRDDYGIPPIRGAGPSRRDCLPENAVASTIEASLQPDIKYTPDRSGLVGRSISDTTA